MAWPTFLASSFRYLMVAAVTDVDTIITNFRSETVTYGSPAWSEPSSNLFKSPVDGDSRWFDVLLTKISATSLEMRIRDWTGATIATRRMQIDAGGNNVHIYSGERHYHIESDRTTPEFVGGGFVDLSPEAQNAHAQTIFGYGYRDNAGTADGASYWYYVGFQGTGMRIQGCCLMRADHSGQSVHYQTYGGANLWQPAIHSYDLSAVKMYGRKFQALLCDGTIYSVGSEITVPLDDSTTGVFRVLGFTMAGWERCAMRKA